MVSRDVSRRKSASGPSASKTSSTDEETEYLMLLWNGEDVSFNCRNKDYFKKDARHSAINRILSCLGKEGENI